MLRLKKTDLDLNVFHAFINQQSLPIRQDDPVLHQLVDEMTGLGTISYAIAPSLKIKLFIIPNLVEVNYIPTIREVVIREKNTRGEQRWYRYTGDMELFRQYCVKAGLAIEEAFLRPHARMLSLQEWDNLSIYETSTHQDYEIIRQSIAADALQLAQQLNNQKKPIHVVDIGTGLGDCLDLTVRELESHGFKVSKAQGIDIRGSNIFNARLRYTDFPYEFFCLDVKDILQEKFSKETFVLVVSSGSLTRKVLDTTYEGLCAFQRLYRIADAVVVGGITEVMLTRKLAAQMGWQVEFGIDNGLDVRFKGNYLLSKATKNPTPKIREKMLDLSKHAQPLAVFLENDQYGDVERLDLSLAYLMPGELVLLLNGMPSVVEVVIAGIEDFQSELTQIAMRKNIRVIVNKARSILDVVDGQGSHLELRKFSASFLSRFSVMKSFSCSVTELAKLVPEHAQSHGLSLNLHAADDKSTELNLLTRLADSADPVAMYRLALYYQESSRVEDLQQSLQRWKTLYEKCYPVLQLMMRVEMKLADAQKQLSALGKNNRDQVRVSNA